MATERKRQTNGSTQGIERHRRVVVKLRDDIDVPHVDTAGDLAEVLQDKGIVAWADLSAEFPGVRLAARFDEIGRDEMSELVTRATETDPTYRPPNFDAYLVVDCPSGVDPGDVLERVRRWKVVDDAFVDPGPTPPPVVAVDDPRSTNQGYLDPAPDGMTPSTRGPGQVATASASGSSTSNRAGRSTTKTSSPPGSR